MNLKRVFAKILDVAIPFIVSGIGYKIASSQGTHASNISNFMPITIFMGIAYLFLNSFSLIFSKGQTLGEGLLKIRSVKIKNNERSISKVIFREICFLFFLFYAFLFPTGWIGLVLLSAPVVKLKNDRFLLIVLDFIFGLKYKD